MVFENVTNAIFTDMCNSNLNPTKLSNDASMFRSILFHQHMFIIFSTHDKQNYIIFDKTKSALKKMSHIHVTISQIICSNSIIFKLCFNP